jgi:outer membrane protein OmpA-like peptidoglycan-associated protein
LVALDDLDELLARLSIAAFRAEKGKTPVDLRDALQTQEDLDPRFKVPSSAAKTRVFEAADNGELDAFLNAKAQDVDVGEAEQFQKLIDAEDRAQLLQALARFPQVERRRLVDLVARENVDHLLEMQNLIKKGVRPEEIRKALALRDRLGDRLASETGGREKLVVALEASIGDSVRDLGGQIDPDGAIVLPNPQGLLFKRGSSEITPNMQASLDKLCHSWLETLMRSGRVIEELRIEGHASTEWIGAASIEDAFLHNLRLSQERAQAVLGRCLALRSYPDVHGWARPRMAAIGYSSARPVLVDGVEDAPKSRRVVFDFDLSPDRLIEDIGRELELGRPASAPGAMSIAPHRR